MLTIAGAGLYTESVGVSLPAGTPMLPAPRVTTTSGTSGCRSWIADQVASSAATSALASKAALTPRCQSIDAGERTTARRTTTGAREYVNST